MHQIAINGACGRMGLALVRLMQDYHALELVNTFDVPEAHGFGSDIGMSAGVGPLGVMVESLSDFSADIVIDFSLPQGTRALLEIIAGKNIALVCGTTGLERAEENALRRHAEHAPVLWAPNFSIGMNVLGRLVAEAASILGEDYDIEIIEAHHRRKKDAPSGSALMLGREAARARGLDPAQVQIHGRHGVTGERPHDEIGFHAIRGGDTVGEHIIWLAGPGERLELTHRVQSRDALATGALKAAIWLAGREAGLYTMTDMLGL